MKGRIMPTTYFLVLLLFSAGLHFVFPIKKIIYPPYIYLGIILIILGITINIWTDTLFKKVKTTVKPYNIPTSLITSGPFQISRHPMYLGMVLILLGEAVVFGTLTTVSSPLLFMILMEVIFIHIEENNLEKRFGKEYNNYRKKVRRWI